MNKQRNLAARSPLLRKGGVHERPKSAKRFQGKRALARQVDEIAHATGSRGDRRTVQQD